MDGTVSELVVDSFGRARCTVCQHPGRAAIDLAIAQRVSARKIDVQYGVGRMSVQRHTADCLPAKIAIVNATRVEKLETSALVDQMMALQKRSLALLDEAEKSGSIADRSKVIRECRENIVAMGRLTGSISAAAGTMNIDARTQNVIIPGLKELTVEELRRLAAVMPNG